MEWWATLHLLLKTELNKLNELHNHIWTSLISIKEEQSLIYLKPKASYFIICVIGHFPNALRCFAHTTPPAVYLGEFSFECRQNCQLEVQYMSYHCHIVEGFSTVRSQARVAPVSNRHRLVLNTNWHWLLHNISCCHAEHLKHFGLCSQNSWEWDAAPDPVRTTGAPGSFMEGGGIVKGNEAGGRRGRMYILKQRGCLRSLAADPTCRWSTQSPGRSKSQGPGWTSLWNGNGA